MTRLEALAQRDDVLVAYRALTLHTSEDAADLRREVIPLRDLIKKINFGAHDTARATLRTGDFHIYTRRCRTDDIDILLGDAGVALLATEVRERRVENILENKIVHSVIRQGCGSRRDDFLVSILPTHYIPNWLFLQVIKS